MAKRDTLWTCVGITKHETPDGSKVVEKVRCGVDLTTRIKSAQSKSYVKSKGVKLVEKRTDFISLPEPMLRLAALEFALTAEEFQSPSDQALIHDQIDSRIPSAPRVKKEVKIMSSKKQELSLDSIKSRARRDISVEDVLGAISQTV